MPLYVIFDRFLYIFSVINVFFSVVFGPLCVFLVVSVFFGGLCVFMPFWRFWQFSKNGALCVGLTVLRVRCDHYDCCLHVGTLSSSLGGLFRAKILTDTSFPLLVPLLEPTLTSQSKTVAKHARCQPVSDSLGRCQPVPGRRLTCAPYISDPR